MIGTLNTGDRVRNGRGDVGTVTAVDEHMASVLFDGETRPGWFSRAGDGRLTVCVPRTAFARHFVRAAELFTEAIAGNAAGPFVDVYQDAYRSAVEASRAAHYPDGPEANMADALARNIRDSAPYFGIHSEIA